MEHTFLIPVSQPNKNSVFSIVTSTCRPANLVQALVLPKLDYCSIVWDPTSSTLAEKLESVQRFAAKLCSKRWYNIIQALNWPTLHSRRSRQKVLLCTSLLNSRTYHLYSVRVPFARTASFQTSFFISACHLWNSLPEQVVSLSASRLFKVALSHLPPFIS